MLHAALESVALRQIELVSSGTALPSGDFLLSKLTIKVVTPPAITRKVRAAAHSTP
jgi:hypothetical protein